MTCAPSNSLDEGYSEEQLKGLSITACLVSAWALAACAGNGAANDVAPIEDAIRTAILGKSSAACTEVVTQAFLEQTTHEAGKAALESCEEEVKDEVDSAKTVGISKLVVDGTRATAELAPVGGNFDGQTIVASLVDEHGQWKLDKLLRFAKLDASALARTVQRANEASGAVPPEQARCIAREIENASRPELEELVLTQPATPKSEKPVLACTDAGAGTRIAPEGAEYEYEIPSRFRPAAPRGGSPIRSEETDVTSVDATGAGQGVGVFQVPSIPIHSKARLRQALPGLTKFFEESVAPTGASASAPLMEEVGGHLAVQWRATGTSKGQFPNTDFEETIVLAEPEAVEIGCRWKRAAQDRKAILKGCEEVLRSLRVTDSPPDASS